MQNIMCTHSYNKLQQATTTEQAGERGRELEFVYTGGPSSGTC